MTRTSISRTVLWIIALFVALVPAACSSPGGAPQAGGSAPAGPTASSAQPSTSPASGTPSGGGGGADCPQGVRTGQVTLSETDSGATVCLATGTSLEIYLHARPGQQWSKPVPDRTILRPVANGKGALQIGVTAGFYTAVEPGQARVTAQLAPCMGPKPGPACDAIQLFEVTVTIR